MGAAVLRRQPVESRSGGSLCSGERSPPAAGTLDPGLGLSAPREPPARENPGPLPGAAALPGRAGGGDSRNLPGDRAGVTEQNRPIYGQRFRRVSGESPGAGRLGGARRTHSAFCPGRLLPCHCLPAPRRCQRRGWRSGCLYWALGYLRGASSKSSGWGQPVLPPPARLGRKKTTEINKDNFFLLK